MRLRILSAIAILAAACGGSTTNPSSGGTSGGTSAGASSLSATIDGAAWKPTKVTARYGVNAPAPYLEVDTNDSALDEFSFVAGPFNGLVGTGTYQIGSSPTNASYILPGGTSIWSALPGQGSGSVTISRFSLASKTASGTFSFVLVKGSSAKTVSNGVFDVTFP